MSQNLEDVWNSCIVVNAKIGKHKTPSLSCNGETWQVQALSTYGGTTPDVLTQQHKTIADAIEGFRQYLLDYLNSNIQDFEKEMTALEEAKFQTKRLIDNLFDK